MTATILHGQGPDPFDGPAALDEAELLALDLYVVNVSRILLRGEWDVTVSRGRPKSEASIAETFVRNSAPEGVIAFGASFFEYPEPYRRKAVDRLARAIAPFLPKSPGA